MYEVYSGKKFSIIIGFEFFSIPFEKQVGSPTKARAGFLKIGLPLNWEAAVGFTKWGTVIFSDLVSKGRLARLE